tara:strand:+ start:80 stop:1525 length:1446 start_codon:yes stop_codon:yes gene_type:complete
MFTAIYSSPCIVDIDNREIVRNEYTFHETIQSENFIIHFTTADIDSQEVFGTWYNLQSNFGYAQSIIDHMENAYSIYMEKGWEPPPPDCDESITNTESPQHCNNFGGNSLYDIYIANDAAGMVVPETSYPVEPYTGGYSSFMKVSTLLNEYDILPSWSYHVIAHELHHAIQLRYGYSVSGEPGNYMYNGWLFEQTATYMENVIYPNSIHLSTMLGNCNISTPLTYPEYNIDHALDIYQYRSALWQKFMVESYGDSSIIRLIWEGYGNQYATGNTVSLFPIYNDAIKQVTNNETEISNAYQDYAIWRYFTGSRNIPDQHFLESQGYCTASTIDISENSIIFPSEKGAAIFIQLEPENENIQLNSSFSSMLQVQHVTASGIISNLLLINNNSYLHVSNVNNEPHALILTSKYTENPSQEISLHIALYDLQGDLNGDGTIDVLDIIILVNLILFGEYNTNADLNEDGVINILDIVIYRNIILGN